MTTADEAILAACRAYLSSLTGWDEDPKILILTRHNDTDLSIHQLVVPKPLWARFHPAEVIVALADASVVTGLVAEPDTVALALYTEGFTISPDASPQAAEAIRRRNTGGSVPSAKHIPGRIEQRRLNAIDRHGRHYVVSADRLSDGSAAPAVAQAISEAGRLTGAIPEALELFCKTSWRHTNPAPGPGASGAAGDDL